MRIAVTVMLVSACGGGGGGSVDASDPPVFPADYAASYTEVRNCRLSIDHDLKHIRVLAAPDALGPYNDRTTPFPVGAVVLKEQHGMDDNDCSQPAVDYTVMQKVATGSATADLDWTWQQVTATFKTETIDVKRCTSCHKDCGVPPNGYDGTCTMP